MGPSLDAIVSSCFGSGFRPWDDGDGGVALGRWERLILNCPTIRACDWINLDSDPTFMTDKLYNLGKELISPESQLSHL